MQYSPRMSIDNVAKLLHAALILISVWFYVLPKRARKTGVRRPAAKIP